MQSGGARVFFLELKLNDLRIEFKTRFVFFGGDAVIDEADSEPEVLFPFDPVDMFEIELLEVRDMANEEASFRTGESVGKFCGGEFSDSESEMAS